MGRARSACEEEARRPFDLVQGPIFRSTLYRLSATEHVLLIVVHHIAFDGWSIGLLLQELAMLYTAYSEGGTSPLPEPLHPVFRLCLRPEAATQRRGPGRARRFLADLPARRAPPHLALPFDHLVSAGRNYRGGRHPVVLGDELTARLKALSRSEGVTLYMSLLAAFAGADLPVHRRRRCRDRYADRPAHVGRDAEPCSGPS